MSVLRKVEGNIRALEERMNILEDKLQIEFFEELEEDFLATKIELDLWEKREASRLGQLAKKKWLTEGDKNSAFFHTVIKQRRLKGIIEKIVLSDGRVLKSAEAIHSEVESCVLGELVDEKVSDEDNKMLCAEPTEMEIIINKLTGIIDKVVSHEQCAFIPGRTREGERGRTEVYDSIQRGPRLLKGIVRIDSLGWSVAGSVTTVSLHHK
ncbi:hypothetical protein ACLOJK_001514 [Asimina triloba]